MVEDYGCIKDNCPHKSAGDNNCEEPSSTDGLAVQCVDKWAEDKFYYFDKYLNATRKARAKYSQNGNAVYIDLLAGPGLCRIKERKSEIKGGALRAVSLEEAPFNKIILNDLSQPQFNEEVQHLGWPMFGWYSEWTWKMDTGS